MSTLEEVQHLPDGKFHLLLDDLLRRLESRYRRLRTHGVNDRGESIKGQPDSYVGNTAATCSIAFCYTVQRKGWWNKIRDDVRDAVAASPAVNEIVVAIPHNIDRDGPTDKTIDWHSAAQHAAGAAILRFIDGRDISSLLDTDHQDLRQKHLGIPYSRLSVQSILTACLVASESAINTIKMSGRYDPNRYAPRNADKQLNQLWQSAFKGGNDKDRRVAPVRLIALVSDSGVGKTSIVCEFARTQGTVLPTLLVQARDLMFDTEDCLVSFVINALQGFLNPAAQVIEEAAVAKHLAGSVKLTVILDGLDEAHNPMGVRRAITFWFNSKLCQSSILITTSRPEFWRTCADPSWVRWMPCTTSEDRPLKVAEHSQIEPNVPIFGIRLPDRFGEDELEEAWLRSGQNRRELFALSSEAREEIRHPFTLRVFLDLLAKKGFHPRRMTRSALLEQWLTHRLDAESSNRVTRKHFEVALQIVARRIAEANAASVTVDELAEVPRFDPICPPGPVVERLIQANVLETLPNQSDCVRFTVEAVQDFYRAEADFEDIKCNSQRMANEFSTLTFTKAYPRLVRIGYRLIGEDIGNAFVQHLASVDARMAAIAVRAAPDSFSTEVRAIIANKLGGQITHRHRVRAAMAITLLGELNCQESIDTLALHLLPPTDPHRYLKTLGALAFIKLSYVPAAQFVYQWEGFGVRQHNDAFYFKELLVNVRGATSEFRCALADRAIQQLSNASGTTEHVKAVTVLAYVGDDRLVDHLADRLERNGLLDCYENHAIIALGTNSAGALFAQSILAVGKRLAVLADDDSNHEARNRLIGPVHFTASDIRYLITPAFETHLQSLIENGDRDVWWIACDLAKRAVVPSLLYVVAMTSANRNNSFSLDRGERRSCVSVELWLGWWKQATDDIMRRTFLSLLPPYPNAEVEEVLIECLDSPELRGRAARALGEYGAVRSALRLRETLPNGVSSDDSWGMSEVAYALGSLRDEAAIPILEMVARNDEELVADQAVASLGVIGNSDAENALRRLIEVKKGEAFDNVVFEAMLRCGSKSAVAVVIDQAKNRLDGQSWLCARLAELSWSRGWHFGEYFTHIHTAELVEYLESNFKPGLSEQNWSVGDTFRQIDSPDVRRLLRKWGSRRGSVDDPLVRGEDQRRLSDMCFWELRDRGDESAIEYTLQEHIADKDNVYVSITSDRLRPFPTAAVGEHIRLRLANATSTSETLRMLALLGRFGEAHDADIASQFIDSELELLANVACETFLRLRDPMLVPDRWREL